jgi:hypothetical protein
MLGALQSTFRESAFLRKGGDALTSLLQTLKFQLDRQSQLGNHVMLECFCQ